MDFAATGLNTRALNRSGWGGVYFDAVIHAPQFNIFQAELSEENIVSHFEAAHVPNNVDYVSIDVDSIDLWLFRGLVNSTSLMRPRVVSVEFNPNYGAELLLTHQREWRPWGTHSVYGASAAALNHIANVAGYTLVHMEWRFDMFFVRTDVLQEICDLGSIPTFDAFSSYLPLRTQPLCNRDDLALLVDLPLALAGREREAHVAAYTAVSQKMPVRICHDTAFSSPNQPPWFMDLHVPKPKGKSQRVVRTNTWTPET